MIWAEWQRQPEDLPGDSSMSAQQQLWVDRLHAGSLPIQGGLWEQNGVCGLGRLGIGLGRLSILSGS